MRAHPPGHLAPHVLQRGFLRLPRTDIPRHALGVEEIRRAWSVGGVHTLGIDLHQGPGGIRLIPFEGHALVVSENETQLEGPCAAFAGTAIVDAVACPFAILGMDQIEKTGADQLGRVEAILAHGLIDEENSSFCVDPVDDIGNGIDDGVQFIIERLELTPYFAELLHGIKKKEIQRNLANWNGALRRESQQSADEGV
ncbi:MAG TPA: hypothetical protein QGF95_10285 [Candidatus Latescibacteria bacterium]|nr:hypothetical protein [Candidatus Latescibacterota bacterium]HJP30930.1 hypothetical protein [Candidatus Latescibacterota bacterium]